MNAVDVACRFRLPALALLCFLVCAACGKTANLGDDAATGSEAPSAPLDPNATVAHRAVGGVEYIAVDLIVDTEFIYFSVSSLRGAELRRCRKEDCQGSARVLVSDPSADRFLGLRLSDRTLSYALVRRLDYGAFEETQFFDCETPDCREPRGSDAFPGMIRTLHVGPRFAHWTNFEDNALYRCPLPECPQGPELAIPGVATSDLAVNETHAFTAGFDGLWHVPIAGGTPEPLKVGNQLEPSTRKVGEYYEDPGMMPIALALDGPWLYLLGSNDDREAFQLLRVPSAGHEATESITELPDYPDVSLPENFAVFDGELVWAQAGSGSDYGHELWSCRVEDCDGTSRQLTAAAENEPGSLAASDSERLYWFEGRSSSEPGIWSAPRLPRP